MISWLRDREVWLYQKPIDFRKQLDGLVYITATDLGKQPNDGAIYIFRNKQKDKLKLLMWDRNGFVMGYKRLETGRFEFPGEETGHIQLNWEQVYLLVSGLQMSALKIIPNKTIQHFF